MASWWRSAREALSSSSTRLRHRTATHVHRIGCYSEITGMVTHGKHIKSAPFLAGGFKWRLYYYPNGAIGSPAGCVSVDLMLKDDPWWELFSMSNGVTAAYEVTVLDSVGRRVLGGTFGPQHFCHWSCAGAKDIGTAKGLMAALRRADRDEVVVRCEVTVMQLEKESGIRWYLRRLIDE